VDDLGEWPLCERHLQEMIDPWHHYLLPVHTKSSASQASRRRKPATGAPEKPGNPYGLTEREMQIAVLCRLPRRSIAEKLNLKEGTVKTHLRHIAWKMRVNSRQEIVQRMLEENVVETYLEALRSQDDLL